VSDDSATGAPLRVRDRLLLRRRRWPDSAGALLDTSGVAVAVVADVVPEDPAVWPERVRLR
jgi:hypothetical protein